MSATTAERIEGLRRRLLALGLPIAGQIDTTLADWEPGFYLNCSTLDSRVEELREEYAVAPAAKQTIVQLRRADVPPSPSATIGVGVKDSSVCLSLTCSCGEEMQHAHGYFGYHTACVGCGQVYRLDYNIEAVPVELTDEDALVILPDEALIAVDKAARVGEGIEGYSFSQTDGMPWREARVVLVAAREFLGKES